MGAENLVVVYIVMMTLMYLHWFELYLCLELYCVVGVQKTDACMCMLSKSTTIKANLEKIMWNQRALTGYTFLLLCIYMNILSVIWVFYMNLLENNSCRSIYILLCNQQILKQYARLTPPYLELTRHVNFEICVCIITKHHFRYHYLN